MKLYPKLVGHLDEYTNGTVRGWAAIKAPFGKTTEVEICAVLDGQVIASSRANILREDLARAGIGTGKYGFQFALPKALATGGPYAVSIVAEPNRQVLEGGELLLQDGERRQGIDRNQKLTSLLDLHARFQYMHLEETIETATGINGELGGGPALAFLYARILGRMPEKQLIAEYDAKSLDDSEIAANANKLFFSAEALSRRG